MAKKNEENKTPLTDDQRRAKQEARLAFLKKNQPKSKEIAELQKKLGNSGTTGGGLTTTGISPESELAREGAKTIIEDADAYGRKVRDEEIPIGTFGKMDVGITPEMQQFLDRLNAFAQTAGDYTQNEQFGIDQLRAGLGGYLAPELQALREQRLRELDAEVATQARQAALAAARGGVRGAYANAQVGALGRQAVQTRGNMEQDLFAQNADVIQQRKEAFNNLVNQTEQTRFGRKQGAESLYGQMRGGEENVQRALQEFNISQGTNEALARSGARMGGAGLYTGLYGTQYSLDESTRAARETAKANLENQKILREQNKINWASLNRTANNVGAGRV